VLFTGVLSGGKNYISNNIGIQSLPSEKYRDSMKSLDVEASTRINGIDVKINAVVVILVEKVDVEVPKGALIVVVTVAALESIFFVEPLTLEVRLVTNDSVQFWLAAFKL
jgi:hypothetical protein